MLAAGDSIFRGNVDLLYRDDDGEVVVADYKTDREDDPRSLGRRYMDQLGVYAEAVRQAMGLATRPRTELWLLRSGSRVALGAGPEWEGTHAD